MHFIIRPETEADHRAVAEVISAAFRDAEHSDGTEADLVARLRRVGGFLPKLSLVAECEGVIIGHSLLSPIAIRTDSGAVHPSLALAPVSVLPARQGQGVGTALIHAGHDAARKLGFSSVIVLGHPEYYPRFGYHRASLWGIKAPFDVPDEAFMALELVPGGLDTVSGTVIYPAAFGIG